jgi:uncharacterized 2Fe-2S/4Fe-4S cluster protein (DUF4445 family)
MIMHLVRFEPSGRSALVREGQSLAFAAEQAGEPLRAECGGRGACGRCLVQILEGEVPDYRVVRHADGHPEVHACLTPVRGALRVLPLALEQLPRLATRDHNLGVAPLVEWAPWPLDLEPLVGAESPGDLGVAVDIGTTTLRLVILRLRDGVVVGEASAYNPQIPRGADVISRIIACERGRGDELTGLVRKGIGDMLAHAAAEAALDVGAVRGYVVAGNLTMIHLLVGADPAGIRRVPSAPGALRFAPVPARDLGWPGRDQALVHTIPAAGGWVGGDIVAGVLRAGFPRADGHWLYVDLGTNGEIALGGRDFALTCACSAGPAFEGSGIRCGMRADRGAIDGVRLDAQGGTVDPSVIGGGAVKGVCGSGLIALADGLLRAGWIDRSGRFTRRLPSQHRVEGQGAVALALSPDGGVALWERDLASLVRAKAAIFAGIRSLVRSLGAGLTPDRVIVSGNFGRFLNLPAAVGIGLLPDLPLGRYGYIDNGSLEGAALALLSRPFAAALDEYVGRVTYVSLSELAGYMDEFVAASFLPHTDPEALQL